MISRQEFIEAALASDTQECILWPFAIRKSSGYAAHTESREKGKKNWDAHRYICVHAHGQPEPGEEASHRCGNRTCINPKHVYWNDHTGNMADAKQHGTLKGGGRGRQRLFPADIRVIAASSASHLVIASQYGLEASHIGAVRRRAGMR